MKPAAFLILLLSLAPAARAVAPAGGGVDDPARPTDDNKLQKGTFACLMLSDPDCGASSNATPILSAPGPTAAPLFTSDRVFIRLLSSYPQGSVDDVKALIGRPGEAWIVNTCAIRVSYAMNGGGFPIDRSVQEPPTLGNPNPAINYISDRSGVRNGRVYIYRVDEFARYMLKKYGRPQVWTRGGAKRGDPRRAVQGKKGVILFVVNSFTNATGHFDLWDGSQPSDGEYFDEASDVFLWQ